jgi:predicted lipid carrier protein YhbT
MTAALRVPGEPVLLALLRAAPFEPQRLLLEKLLRDAFPNAADEDCFGALRGRWLRLEVQGGAGWNVTLGRDSLLLAAGPVAWDVRIAASLDDFVLLANQQADPDTLFFQRRLVIEGDTELGLQIRNVIFGSELGGAPAKLAQMLLALRTAYVERRWPPLPRSLAVFAAGFTPARALDAARKRHAGRG